jgi:hypothetical protein
MNEFKLLVWRSIIEVIFVEFALSHENLDVSVNVFNHMETVRKYDNNLVYN